MFKADPWLRLESVESAWGMEEEDSAEVSVAVASGQDEQGTLLHHLVERDEVDWTGGYIHHKEPVPAGKVGKPFCEVEGPVVLASWPHKGASYHQSSRRMPLFAWREPGAKNWESEAFPTCILRPRANYNGLCTGH